MKKLIFLLFAFSSFTLSAQLPVQKADKWIFHDSVSVDDGLKVGYKSGSPATSIYYTRYDQLGRLFYYNDVAPTLGMLLKGNGTYYDNFAKGTSRQYLRVNAAGTDLEWTKLKKADFDDLTAYQLVFGDVTGNGQAEQSAFLTFTPATQILYLNGRLNITGIGNSSATKSLYIESSTAELRMEVYDSDLIRLRPSSNNRYNFQNAVLSFTSDAGVIRAQTIQGGTITWDFARHTTTNSTLTPASTAGNYYFWNLSNSNDIGAAQGLNDLIVWKTEPTWNLTNVLSTGKVIGYYYNPTVTSLAGSNPHYFLYATSGLTKLGDVTQDDALTKIMALDASNRVYWRDASTIGSDGTVTSFAATDNTTFDFTVTDPSTTVVLTAILKDRDWGDVTLTSSGTVLTIDAGAVSNAKLANSTISGISLGSNLADLTATNSTLTFSGTYNGSAARTIGLNLNNANTWTADQSVPDEAYGATWNGSVEVPTKNAVYDKINAMPYYLDKTVTDVSITASTSETKMYSILVPANTLTAGQIINVVYRTKKTGTNGNFQTRFRFGTADDLSGSILETTALGSTILFGQFQRTILIKDATTFEVYPSTSNGTTDMTSSTSAATSVTVNLAVDNYFVISVQLTNGADTGIFSGGYFEIY